MVSFQAPLSPNQRKPSDHLSKKRKWEEPFADQIFQKRSKAEETTNPIFDIDQHDHFDTPLPLEWQRCLDIQVYICLYLNCLLKNICISSCIWKYLYIQF